MEAGLREGEREGGREREIGEGDRQNFTVDINVA